MVEPFYCPHCGAVVPPDAVACPECGSDEETGWSQEAAYQDLFFTDRLPDLEPLPPSKVSWMRYLMGGLAVVLVLAYLLVRVTWGVYVVLVVLVGAGVFYTMRRFFPVTGRGIEKALYEELLRRARGDAALVERLLTYERQRNPTASRLELLEDALYRWERDSQ